MTEFKEKWYAGMRKKLGVETDDEVREFMRRSGQKASRPGTGGFAYMKKHDPERLKQISRDSLKKRWYES